MAVTRRLCSQPRRRRGRQKGRDDSRGQSKAFMRAGSKEDLAGYRISGNERRAGIPATIAATATAAKTATAMTMLEAKAKRTVRASSKEDRAGYRICGQGASIRGDSDNRGGDDDFEGNEAAEMRTAGALFGKQTETRLLICDVCATTGAYDDDPAQEQPTIGLFVCTDGDGDGDAGRDEVNSLEANSNRLVSLPCSHQYLCGQQVEQCRPFIPERSAQKLTMALRRSNNRNDGSKKPECGGAPRERTVDCPAWCPVCWGKA